MNSSPLAAKNVDVSTILTHYSVNCQYLTVCAVSFLFLTALPLFFLIKYAKKGQLCRKTSAFVLNANKLKLNCIRAPPLMFFTNDKEEEKFCG